VAASLAARDGVTPELASALWLKYNLLGEKESRAYRRVFVEYTSLLSDWRSELSRIAATLAVDLSVRDETAVDGFLRQDLRHQRHHGQLCDTFGLGWISRIHDALAAAARGEPPETAVFDEVFESYRRCERSMRIALADFQARSKLDAQRNPRITTLIYATAGRGSQVLKACIDSRWYRAQNPDVITAGRDPYEHWITYGFMEGRLPCEDPLSLLNSLMREKASRPAAAASVPTAAAIAGSR
jgi:hypothetical protein